MPQDPTIDTETQILDLQARIAWLESANDELSTIIYQQEQRLDAMERRSALVAERLIEISSAQAETAPGEGYEVPPHY